MRRRIEYNPCFEQKGWNYISTYETKATIINIGEKKVSFQTINKFSEMPAPTIHRNEETEKIAQELASKKQSGIQILEICWTLTSESLMQVEFQIFDEDLNTEGLSLFLDKDPRAATALSALKAEPNVFLITHDFKPNPEIHGNVLDIVATRGVDLSTKLIEGHIAKTIDKNLKNPFSDKESACLEISRFIVK